MMLTPNKRIGQVSHGPYRGATYCRVSVPQDSGIPLAIKANLSGFHDYDLPKGTWVEVSRRSEEHTSELQSLMRISYAVCCLKKKKTAKKESIIKKHEDNRGTKDNIQHRN